MLPIHEESISKLFTERGQGLLFLSKESREQKDHPTMAQVNKKEKSVHLVYILGVLFFWRHFSLFQSIWKEKKVKTQKSFQKDIRMDFDEMDTGEDLEKKPFLSNLPSKGFLRNIDRNKVRLRRIEEVLFFLVEFGSHFSFW